MIENIRITYDNGKIIFKWDWIVSEGELEIVYRKKETGSDFHCINYARKFRGVPAANYEGRFDFDCVGIELYEFYFYPVDINRQRIDKENSSIKVEAALGNKVRIEYQISRQDQDKVYFILLRNFKGTILPKRLSVDIGGISYPVLQSLKAGDKLRIKSEEETQVSLKAEALYKKCYEFSRI